MTPRGSFILCKKIAKQGIMFKMLLPKKIVAFFIVLLLLA